MRRQDGLRMTLQPSRSAPQKIDLLFENEEEKKREKKKHFISRGKKHKKNKEGADSITYDEPYNQ